MDASLCLNRDLQKISNWTQQWLVTFNVSKNESMVISRKSPKPYHPPIFMDGIQVMRLIITNISEFIYQITVLGIVISTMLKKRLGKELILCID